MSVYKDFWHTCYQEYTPSKVFLVSHVTYFEQLLYLGKLSRPKYHEFSLKLLILSMLQY